MLVVERQRGIETTLLNLRRMFAAGGAAPRLGRGLRVFVVSNFDKKELLAAIAFRKSIELRKTFFPGGGKILRARVRGLAEREVGEHSEVIERVPELHGVVFVPIRAVGQLPKINCAHRGDDL